jgi:probable LLM family oxidoreductase
MQLGVFSFGDREAEKDGDLLPPGIVLAQALERIKLADEVGLGFYGLGEHHIDRYAVSSPATVLAAAASITKNITLSSSVTVLSSEDPVRLYQQFATLDLLSSGRAEIIAGRGSFTESFPLFGASLNDYDALYDEKLELLLRIDAANPVTWHGRFREPLTAAGIYPRPYTRHLAISEGTGGSPGSSVRAGLLGLPIVYAIIGGHPEAFAPRVDLYRQASAESGHGTDNQHVTFSGIGLVADRSQDAKDTFYPHWQRMMNEGARARGWHRPSREDYEDYTAGSQMLFAGSPAEIAERIITVGSRVGAQRYGLQMDWAGVPHAAVMRAIELLGTQVRPAVEAELGVGGDVHDATPVRPNPNAVAEPVGAR